MRKEDMIIGNKYTPINKTIGTAFHNCKQWIDRGGKEQGYLYFVDIDEDGVCVFNTDPNDKDGNFYRPEDVEPYEEILISSTQQMCDDILKKLE